MKTFPGILIIAMCAVHGIAQASVCPGSNVVQDPPMFQWVDAGNYWRGTLEIGEATLTIGSDTLTTRAYRQAGGTFSIPGPTMNMTPGETYVLTFKNTLPYETPSPVHNDLKDPNITNIHTHGLHVSGETPADDVMRMINGGYCGDYVYQVPSDHMGGTLWYHAHHHGSTYLQVSTGAFGLLIINDSGDGIPANVAGMTERQLAIAFLDPSVAGAGGDTLVSGTLSPTWTVNGKIQGNICMPPNEWQHWRVLLADRDGRIKTLSVQPTNACEVAMLARDGVWRTVAPKELLTNSIQLTGASRADLAVRCSADATITIDGTTVARVFADSTLPANLTVGPYNNGAAGTTWSATRPSYLRDLRGVALVENRSVNMGARTINGNQFDEDVATFPSTASLVQEWTIQGATQHPFHQHVYHVQMKGACGNGAYENGEYYDTVAGNCLVRFDLNPATASVFQGRTMMHCHILMHEDEGAMGWTNVSSGFGPPAFPDPNQQALYQCSSACQPTETTEISCSDGIDNDCDDLTDNADPDCPINADLTPPTTSITAPAGASTVSGTINVNADADDNIAVTKVEFYVDGALIGTDTGSPYSISWNTTTISNGSHNLTSKAYDAANNTGTSAIVSVTVSNSDTTPPTTFITSPAAGSVVSGTRNVTASATDNVAVKRVEFYLDGNIKLGSDAASPYTISWNTNIVPNGNHNLTSKAFDTSNYSSTSPAVTVNVNNPNSCTVSAQLIQNGAFESGTTGWGRSSSTGSTSGMITNSLSYSPHTGTWYAKLNGFGTTTTQTITTNSATMVIPAEACVATFTFWLSIGTGETTTTTANDNLVVQIQTKNNNGSFGSWSTLATFSNLDSTGLNVYAQHSFNLLAYKGKTVKLRFQGKENSSLQTTFLMDDVALNVTQ